MPCGAENRSVAKSFGSLTKSLVSSTGKTITFTGVIGWIAAALGLLGAMEELTKCAELNQIGNIEALREEVDKLQEEVDRLKQEINN
ncbi:hypothetical protein [Mycobacterium sp.]|uniref:hypothetical protein n=1 Tax=Mycobacterium sp. TaxID=1785 RepID=UPI003D0ADBB4